MKKLLVVFVVVIGFGLYAWGGVADLLTPLIGSDCLTIDDLQLIVAEFGTAPVELSIAGSCATIGDISAFIFDAFGFTGTFLDRLFGMSLEEKIAVLQRNNAMIVGSPTDTLTGIDLAAIFTGLADYLLHQENHPEWLALDMDALGELFLGAQALLPTGALGVLIPGLSASFSPVPTS